jgi:hypothetical protein
MSDFRIAVSLVTSLPGFPAVNAQAFPHLAAAVRDVVERAHRQWADYAAGAPLPDGRAISTRTGAYGRSLQVEQTGPFAGRVFTDLRYAAALEYGTPARDLHDMLGSSLKVRVAKDGKRYLIIPFRSYHSRSVVGSPMPAAIENWWRGVPDTGSSHIRAHSWRQSGTGALAFKNLTTGHMRLVRGKVVEVRARKYRWGTRLSANAIRSMGLGEEAVKRYAGMVRFSRPKKEGSTKPGGHSQFINFRVLKEGSPGWRVPARPGYHVAKTVSEKIRPFAESAFKEAVTRDVRKLLGQG